MHINHFQGQILLAGQILSQVFLCCPHVSLLAAWKFKHERFLVVFLRNGGTHCSIVHNKYDLLFHRTRTVCVMKQMSIGYIFQKTTNHHPNQNSGVLVISFHSASRCNCIMKQQNKAGFKINLMRNSSKIILCFEAGANYILPS